MSIEINKKQDYTVILINYRQLNFDAVLKISAIATQEADNSGGKLLFDFSKVDIVDSKALAFIISLHKYCLSKGGKLGLFSVNTDVMNLLTLTNFNQVLDIYTDQEHALSQHKDSA